MDMDWRDIPVKLWMEFETPEQPRHRDKQGALCHMGAGQILLQDPEVT